MDNQVSHLIIYQTNLMHISLLIKTTGKKINLMISCVISIKKNLNNIWQSLYLWESSRYFVSNGIGEEIHLYCNSNQNIMTTDEFFLFNSFLCVADNTGNRDSTDQLYQARSLNQLF